ncbi:MAG: RNA methyltransferase [Candidatus Thorarchaeota archaeon]
MQRLIVVLVEPETPGNVGFVARAMANFGVKRLRIVGRDLRNNDEAQKFAMHAGEILDRAEVFSGLDSALEGVPASWATTARTGGTHSVVRAPVPMDRIPDMGTVSGDIAIVFGREGSGLTNEELALCDLAFRIPVSPEYPSMNLSHAVSVVLYDLYRRYGICGNMQVPRARPATRSEKDQASMFFSDVIDRIPIPAHRKPIAKRVFKNIIGRAYVTGREITTMTGVIREIRDLLCRDHDVDAGPPDRVCV